MVSQEKPTSCSDILLGNKSAPSGLRLPLDQDMALSLFNFKGFIDIVELLNIQIAAPALLSKTHNGRSTPR